MATITPDAQLTNRLNQAIANRDKARDIEIGLRTAASIARKNADEAKARALAEYGVDSLDDLRALAEKTYRENLEKVTAFETQVVLYVNNVKEAEKLIQDDNTKAAV